MGSCRFFSRVKMLSVVIVSMVILLKVLKLWKLIRMILMMLWLLLFGMLLLMKKLVIELMGLVSIV